MGVVVVVEDGAEPPPPPPPPPPPAPEPLQALVVAKAADVADDSPEALTALTL